MGTSENAIKYHIANIGSKLGVSGLAALRQWPGYPARQSARTKECLDEHRHRQARRPRPRPRPRPSRPGLALRPTTSRGPSAFYRDTLGLPHIFTFGELAFFDMGGVRLYVHCVPDADWKAGSILYFRVDDIDATVKRLGAAGVTFVGQPHRIHRDEATGDEEWMAFFEDPDRNMLALMSRVHAPV